MSTFRRLLSFLRPYRRGLMGSLLLAWAAMGMTVLIPWLIGRTIDAIVAGTRPDLLPLIAAIIGAGLLRLALTVSRRVIAGKVSLAVEFDLRARIYGHLQALELGFFDTQQTGQLMSRATVDLQSIRFFLGYGLIFLTQNLLTITLAAIVMIAIQPTLALLALAPVPVVVWTASRYNRSSRPALQEVQQRIAELTAEAEESVSGVRVVKAFAREEHMLKRFRHSVTRVFDQNVYSTRLRAFYNPLIGFLPNFGLAVVLGFIALALVFFSLWNPWILLGGSLLFGFLWQLSLNPQLFLPGVFSRYIWRTVPFVITLLVLMVMSTKWFRAKWGSAKPEALGEPYVKG